jgi:hypothetical protein
MTTTDPETLLCHFVRDVNYGRPDIALPGTDPNYYTYTIFSRRYIELIRKMYIHTTRNHLLGVEWMVFQPRGPDRWRQLGRVGKPKELNPLSANNKGQ